MKLKSIYNIKFIKSLASLEIVRQKYLFLLNVVIVVLASGLAIINLSNQEFQDAAIRLSFVLVSSISLILSYKKLHNLAATITLVLINAAAFLLAYNKLLEPIEIFPHSILLMMSTLFLIKKSGIRIGYIMICAILITLVCIKFEYTTLEFTSLLLTVIFNLFINNIFIYYVEQQNKSLSESIDILEMSNLSIEKLNKSLEEKNEEIIGYTYAMNHDLKSPIRNILSFVNLIEDNQGIKGEDNKEYFKYVKNSTQSLNSLVSELLKYSKVSNETLSFNLTPMNEIIDEVLVDFKYDLENNKVKVEIGELPIIYGNETQLKNLFYNLISNGIKYQPKDEEHIAHLSINSYDDSAYHYIEVSDNGIGIKEEYRDNLFVPFKRFHNNSEYEGTGLGMSICKKVMEKHNGRIELKSSSPKGTTFKLAFKKL